MSCPPEARKLNSAWKTWVHVYEKLQFGPKTAHPFFLRKLLINHPTEGAVLGGAVRGPHEELTEGPVLLLQGGHQELQEGTPDRAGAVGDAMEGLEATR